MVALYTNKKQISLMISLLVIASLFVISCQKHVSKGDAYKEVPLIVWPKPPETARIKFISSVSNPLDFSIRQGIFKKFIDYLAGKTIHSIVSPYGVETDSNHNLYVVDTYLKIVHVFNVEQKEYYAFPKNKTKFSSPIDLAIDNKRGRIFVSDSQQGVVKIFDGKGKKYTGEIGKGVFERPTGIAINENTSELLVIDTLSSNIFRYNLETLSLIGIFGQSGIKSGKLHYPTNIFVGKDGSIIVSDSLNFRVQVFSSNGTFQRTFGSAGDNPGYFTRPKGVASDSEGNIYVVDNLFDNIQIFDKQNRLLMAFGNHGKNSGEFWMPTGIFIDKNDRIYVADSYNKRIQIFQFLKTNPIKAED
ncbi:MAG: 6-bladed beta-propeller [Desulfobacula sp.]|jgi:DNA-binding beta-propeller fold protein YncE|nr:6-bladed beta-propeller [Desulfobacula sp.]